MSLGDIIFGLAQWLRSTPMTPLSLGIQKTWLSTVITGHFWIVPAIQTIHILAIAMTFGAVLMVNLRILQLAGTNRDMAQTARRYLPWVWWGLLALLASGVGIIFSDPVRNLTNPVFWSKMIMIAVAATISLWFQGSVRRNAPRWELTRDGQILLRAGAGGVISLWCLIMFAGRWIAYAPT